MANANIDDNAVPAASWQERRHRFEANKIAERKAELLAERDSRDEGSDQGHFLHEIMETAHKVSEDARHHYTDYLVTLRSDMARAISTSLGLTDEQFFGIMTGTHIVIPVS